MKNKLRQKIPRIQSKKGMSLVELLVGVTIIAMVMASAAGAIVTGYKTTIDNAERNEAAASSASLNELIMKEIKNCRFEKAESDDANGIQGAADYFFGVDSTAKSPNDDPDNAVHQMAKSLFPDVHYTNSSNYPDSNYDVQYTIDTAATSELKSSDSASTIATIKGITIKTAVQTADGFAEITSFIPYLKQS